MKTTNESILIISVLLTLTMGLASYLSYKWNKEEELWHHTQLWISLTFNVVVLFLFHQSSRFRALGFIGSILSLGTFRIFLEDLSGNKNLTSRWQDFILLGGGALSMGLSFYFSQPLIYSLPISLAVGITGLNFVRSAQLSHLSDEPISPLKYGVFLISGVYFLKVLFFPILISTPFMSPYSLYADLLLYACLGGTALPAYYATKGVRDVLHLEDAMKEKSEKILEQSKYSELGMMSAGIAHEINNPLAVIQARTTQLLRIYNKPEKQKEIFDGLTQILNTSKRIDRTIQGIREFVHQDESLVETEVYLNDLVEDVLVFCGQRMKNHGVSLRFYGLKNYAVVGNKIQLEQIILNLFNNSFDAIEFLADKWIELSCEASGDHIQLYFKDSGHGIPFEISSRMMDAFFSTKVVGKGTGLGLALAKGLAEKHHGSLDYVRDCPHTTFKLELPRYESLNIKFDQLHH